MGSYITLEIDKLQVDWAKNHIGRDHSPLFVLPDDVKRIDFNEDDEVFSKEFCARKLSLVKNRLDLLGYSLPQLKQLYDEHINFSLDDGYKINLLFEDYVNIITSINIANYSIEEEHGKSRDLDEYIKEQILLNDEIKRNIPVECLFEEEWNSPLNGLSDFLIGIDPYIIIRLLAENPANGEVEMKWDFGEIVNSGWVKIEEIIHDLLPENKILIVTEGSTDSYIIKKSIENLTPDITDFFDFIDMEQNYPFTGTGNLHNFCLGLDKIKIQNKIIVIFDNDTIGNESIKLLSSKIKSKNIVVVSLPELRELESFKTVGPQGETIENINGKAVAIECFLDFSSVEQEPKIRWTSYSEKMEQYQGALIKKDDYTRKFKKANLKQGQYDCSKLNILIDYLIKTCSSF